MGRYLTGLIKTAWRETETQINETEWKAQEQIHTDAVNRSLTKKEDNSTDKG